MTPAQKSECPVAAGQIDENQNIQAAEFATGECSSKATSCDPPPVPMPDKAAIHAALSVLLGPADIVEVRAIHKGRKRIDAGYFDAAHWSELADRASHLSECGAAVYITLNPVDPQLLSRTFNRIETYAQSTTADKQVTQRRWLLIDLDPVRPSDTSATDPQLEAAKVKAIAVHGYLVAKGWPPAMTALSGNGYHLLYAIDLPNNDASTALVKNVLNALANRFDDEYIKVDRTVFNAARICKLYGTVATKGDHTPTAPWRLSQLLDTPARTVVTVEQLAMLNPATTAPAAAVANGLQPIASLIAQSFSLEDFLTRHSMAHTADLHNGSERFKLAVCPFDASHVNGAAAIFRQPSGALGFKCQHNSCATRHWIDVRDLLDGPRTPAVTPVPVSSSNGGTTAPIGTLTADDLQRLRGALAAIPATASLGSHSAGQVIGMALRHVSSCIDTAVGRSLCTDWDALTGGMSVSVFNASDPNYSATAPLGLSSVFSMAQSHGWSGSAPWASPTPLPDALPPVMAFEGDLLPAALRGWVTDIAHRMQCPPDFPAVAALVALSSLIGARAVVHPKALDPWQVVPNLWGLVVGRPGVKKSPALSETLRPLEKMQQADLDAWQTENAAWLIDCQVAAMQSEANAKQAKNLAANDPVAARALLAPVVTPAEPSVRRYIVNDATVEKLGELMQQNPWGLLTYRDELYGLLTSMDKPGQEGARAFMLQSYDGNQGYTFDRIGRGTVHIPRVCLAMIGGIQPGRIQDYVRGAVTGGSADDGLLQRFGLAVWPDIASKYIHVDQPPDAAAMQTALAVFDRLAMLQTASETDPVVWRFDEAAQALFVNWLVPFEEEIRGNELHPAMVSHLAKYRKLIPALALIFALVDTPDSDGVIHEAELKRALAMGDYLRSHANRLYAAAVLPETNGATTLLEKIQASRLTANDGSVLEHFTARQVAVKNWRGLAKPADVRKAADLLVDYDYLRRDTVPMSPLGGRPSERYAINPLVLKGITVGVGLQSPQLSNTP